MNSWRVNDTSLQRLTSPHLGFVSAWYLVIYTARVPYNNGRVSFRVSNENENNEISLPGDMRVVQSMAFQS